MTRDRYHTARRGPAMRRNARRGKTWQGMAARGRVRLCWASYGAAWQGHSCGHWYTSDGMPVPARGRHGWLPLTAWHRPATRGRARRRLAWLGSAGRGSARQGLGITAGAVPAREAGASLVRLPPGQVRHGRARLGLAQQGAARQCSAWQSCAGHGLARHGSGSTGVDGLRPGSTPGYARKASQRNARPRVARHGSARPGMAWVTKR